MQCRLHASLALCGWAGTQPSTLSSRDTPGATHVRTYGDDLIAQNVCGGRWVNNDILTFRLISSLKSFQIFLDKNEIGAIKCRPWLCESHAGSSQIIQCPRATLRISVTVRLLLLALHLAHQGTHPLQSSQSETRVQSTPERCRR